MTIHKITVGTSPTFGWFPIGASIVIGIFWGAACLNALLGLAVIASALLLCLLVDAIIIAILEGRQ